MICLDLIFWGNRDGDRQTQTDATTTDNASRPDQSTAENQMHERNRDGDHQIQTDATTTDNASHPGQSTAENQMHERNRDGDHQTQTDATTTDNASQTDQSTTEQQICEKLRTELQEARIEYPPESHHFFVPDSAKDSIITAEVIASEILAAEPSLGCDNAKKQANQRKGGEEIKALDDWKPADLESLGRKQWHMLSPIFNDEMEHYNLHQNTILPFVTIEEDTAESIIKSGGGYSDVFVTHIHTSHHRFYKDSEPEDEGDRIAIKRLHNHDEAEFQKERSIHVILGRKRITSPHLVKLLATYEYKDKYHFIFPRANCNLRKYWAKTPAPPFTAKTLLWSIKQMVGIATALNIIHNFRTTVPLDGKRGFTPTGDVKFSVEEGEQLYGRHGDIKPENILWFERLPQHQRQDQNGNNFIDDDEGGILQITDFGLGRFHGRDSKTEQQPNGVFGSPTYEPPECKLRRPVSRLYDLWSLGCLYLEFATWLLKGDDAINEFSDHRACQSSIDPRLSDDYFFKVVRDEPVMDAVVRDGVKDWAQSLHADEKCSEFIHDLVDLVMKDLLLIDAKDRIKTPALSVSKASGIQYAYRTQTFQ
ncbi:CMGC/CDK protein kinase [Lasiodiplodia theobromae]|uniref:CMGC/CDK protein kinase n=1 Tax=Lasiodiplodia theobromae TaxID=45133 RepID=UPI0015C35B02|nr:CMGC/CDK protein kinase [Lasiodiplodia theobromae]KAF4544500.1 CMGC/CDK protein kinase [Lasiodiplodia theobromae]